MGKVTTKAGRKHVASKLLLVEQDGTRRDVTGAIGFVIKVGRTEIDVVPEVVPVVEGSAVRVRTNGPRLVLGPGDGNGVILRALPRPPRREPVSKPRATRVAARRR